MGDPAGLPRRLPDRPQKSEAPGTEINCFIEKHKKEPVIEPILFEH
jgi:hypothetical protein